MIASARHAAGPPPYGVVAVAVSGGRDSIALLHAAARAAQALGLHVAALHVHHNLMPEADAWAAGVQRLCARWARDGWPVSCHVHRVPGRPARGDSLEAWARRERHAALAAMAAEAGATLVLLAQHRRDQAETVLLQLLRGGGPRGLAAMPAAAVRAGQVWARPWLDQPREAIDAYVRAYRLKYVDDRSNIDLRLGRGALRAAAWPALTAAFPAAEASLALAARRAAEASALLDEVAAADLQAMASDTGLDVPGWLRLSPARRANALRAWLGGQLAGGAPESLVQRLLADLPRTRSARWPVDAAQAGRLYRGRLRIVPVSGDPISAPPPDAALDLSRPGRHPVPAWGGSFVVESATGGAKGVPARLLRPAELRPRSGGERFAMASQRPARSLKKQYQALGVPQEARQGPLVWSAGQLVFVPGLGLDAVACQEPGRARRSLRWVPGG